MTLIPWRPLFDFDNFFDHNDRFMPTTFGGEMSVPAMDIYENDKEVVAEINAPGMDVKDFDVSINDGILTVRGATETKKEDKGKGYWKKEIHRGSFVRNVQLPSNVKEENVDATYTKGVLKIVMQKTKQKIAPRIEVKSRDD